MHRWAPKIGYFSVPGKAFSNRKEGAHERRRASEARLSTKPKENDTPLNSFLKCESWFFDIN